MYCVYGNSSWYIRGGPLYGGGPLLGGSVIGSPTVDSLFSTILCCIVSVFVVKVVIIFLTQLFGEVCFSCNKPCRGEG